MKRTAWAGTLLGCCLAAAICLIGCDGGNGESADSVPDYQGLSIENLPASTRLDVPTRRSMLGFCYMESLSMMLAHLNGAINATDVFAAAGLGAPVFCGDVGGALRAMNGSTAAAQIAAMNLFGVKWVVGHAAGGNDGTYLDGAAGKLVYPAEQALAYLKAALSAGAPVQVHLDLGYMGGYNCKFSNMAQGSSHFMAVTGYDADRIYVNDTYTTAGNENQYKDMGVPNDVFLSAWQHGGDMNAGNELQTGPYWMLFFTATAASDVNIPAFSTVTAVQKSLSINNLDNLGTYISKIQSGEYGSPSLSDMSGLARVKNLFGEYLIDNGLQEAGQAYQALGSRYEGSWGSWSKAEIINALNTIRSDEMNARTLLP